MKLVRVFFLFSILSVLFLSAQAASPAFVDSPAHCFAKKSYPCSVRVMGSYLAFEREAQMYHLADRSAVLFLGPSEIQLMQGSLWVKDSKGLTVKVSPVFSFQVAGEIFLEKKGLDLFVRNLRSEIAFDSKLVFASEALPVGFENWYGPLDVSGQVSRGMIRPIAMNEFLKAWIPVSGASIAEIKKQTLHYKNDWKGALELSSQIYQQVVERRIASQEEKALRAAQKRRSQLDEQARLRQMFRQKNGLNGL